MIISWLLGRLYFYGAMFGGFGLALFAAWLKGRQAGRDAYIAKREAEKARARQAGEEIRNDVSQTSDRSLDRRLRRWLRD
jgi:hypothetical protein